MATAFMICPGWQKPHCGTSSSSHAFWMGWVVSGESPSIVTIFWSAVKAETGMLQERVGTPST